MRNYQIMSVKHQQNNPAAIRLNRDGTPAAATAKKTAAIISRIRSMLMCDKLK